MLITTAHAAKLYKIPVRTVQRWATDGRLTGETRAGKVWVDDAEVQQLAEHRHGGRLPAWPRCLTSDRAVAHASH